MNYDTQELLTVIGALHERLSLMKNQSGGTMNRNKVETAALKHQASQGKAVEPSENFRAGAQWAIEEIRRFVGSEVPAEYGLIRFLDGLTKREREF